MTRWSTGGIFLWRTDESPINPSTWTRWHRKKRERLKVEYGEVEVDNAIRATAGVWDTRQNVWKLVDKQVMALRIMDLGGVRGER